MLITPVQPYNSLNNMVIQNEGRLGDTQPDHNSKIKEVKSLVKKPPTVKARKFSSRGSDGSIFTTKKEHLLEHKYQENTQRKAANKLRNIDEDNGKLTERKQILADVLKDYKQISKDKDILTAEIKNMKIYLSDIRSKLDQSLTVLNSNTTLFAMKNSRANSLLSAKAGRAKKIGSKKRKSKAGRNDRNEDSLVFSESFLTKESLLKNTVSALTGEQIGSKAITYGNK